MVHSFQKSGGGGSRHSDFWTLGYKAPKKLNIVAILVRLKSSVEKNGMEVATRGRILLTIVCIAYIYYTIWVLGTVGLQLKCA
jgi:bacteriorhodopsin